MATIKLFSETSITPLLNLTKLIHKNYRQISPIVHIRKILFNIVGENTEKLELSFIASEKIKMVETLENVSLQIKHLFNFTCRKLTKKNLVISLVGI